MQPLHQAIATTLQEAARGIAAAGPLPAGLSQLTPDRLELKLNFALDEAGNAAIAGSGPHSLTLEFRLNGPAASGLPLSYPTQLADGGPAAEGGGDIFETLQTIFGPPGFDSSARATVFREALAQLDQAQARAAAARLHSGVSLPADEVTRQAGDVLRGICHSGPLKSAARGGELLVALLDRQPVAAVLAEAEARWKTHDDWLG